MSVLVSISNNVIGAESVNSVNARDLHRELGVGRDFSNWIKGRIEQYCFVQGEDYEALQPAPLPIAKSGDLMEQGSDKSSETGLKSAIEYVISLDMAKELAMVENNSKGREVRKYFIAAEKELQVRLAASLFMEHHRERAELRVSAERAIAGNVSDRAKLGVRVHNGLTSAEWQEIREMIDSIAEYGDGSVIESDKIYNAVHAHMFRYFGASNGAGGCGVLPFRGAMAYLREIRARYSAGYRPKYVAGRLEYDETMS